MFAHSAGSSASAGSKAASASDEAASSESASSESASAEAASSEAASAEAASSEAASSEAASSEAASAEAASSEAASSEAASSEAASAEAASSDAASAEAASSEAASAEAASAEAASSDAASSEAASAEAASSEAAPAAASSESASSEAASAQAASSEAASTEAASSDAASSDAGAGPVATRDSSPQAAEEELEKLLDSSNAASKKGTPRGVPQKLVFSMGNAGALTCDCQYNPNLRAWSAPFLPANTPGLQGLDPVMIDTEVRNECQICPRCICKAARCDCNDPPMAPRPMPAIFDHRTCYAHCEEQKVRSLFTTSTFWHASFLTLPSSRSNCRVPCSVPHCLRRRAGLSGISASRVAFTTATRSGHRKLMFSTL